MEFSARRRQTEHPADRQRALKIRARIGAASVKSNSAALEAIYLRCFSIRSMKVSTYSSFVKIARAMV